MDVRNENPAITAGQRSFWRISLELKLRRSNGDSFQDFFCQMMTAAHGSDFVRVRPFGVLGDKGCDGYLDSHGHVFQCYGALNADSGKVQYLIDKMEEDFGKAMEKLVSIMKEWSMVHNLVDGLPVEAIEKLTELRKLDVTLKLGFVGIEGFEERIFALEISKIEDLLGIAATSRDAQDLQATELRDLVAALVSAADEIRFDVVAIRPVPVEKLKFNNLPAHWQGFIAGGWPNAILVANYFERHHDPMIGEKVAQLFRTRYQYLKAQHLAPGAIMSALYEYVAGVGSIAPSRQVAAQALLAYLFESCDIFEDRPADPKQ
jgi:hypothetical protein